MSGFAPVGARVGRYILVDGLGEGARAVVYVAYDPELDRTVALKVLRARAGDVEDEHGARLQQEARAMARVGHPNVVAVFDTGIHDGRIFIAMERVHGTTLREWLTAKRRAWQDIVEVFLQAGRGIVAVHAADVIHRDFDPENVLVGIDGRVRVNDFGQIRADGEAATRSEPVHFAAALYEALYAEPLSGKGVPARLRRVLLRATTADAAQRYPSMEALLSALGRRPLLRWPRPVFLLATTAAAGLGLWGLSAKGAKPEMRCQGADRKLVGLWDEGRKHVIGDAFRTTDLPYAEHAFRAISESLDAYAREWTRDRTDACEATWVRGEQSPARLDLRMACLDESLNEMGALTALYARADPETVQHAVVAAESLPQLARCADVAALERHEQAEPDPTKAAHIESVKEALAEISARRSAGHMKEARERIPSVVEEARDLGSALEARALFLHGQLLFDVRPKDAETALYQAAWAADLAGDDAIRARIWSELLFVVGLQHRMNEVRLLNAQAMAAIARAGNDEDLELARHQRLGTVLREAGRLAESRAEEDAALALARKLYGPESRQVAASVLDIGWNQYFSGDHDGALKSLEEGRSLFVRVFGSAHPNVAAALGGMASVLSAKGEHEKAAVTYREELAISEKAWGALNIHIAPVLNNLADELRELGQPREAIALHARAVALQETIHGPDHPSLVLSILGLGRAYFDAKEVGPARLQFERALRLCSEGTDPSVRADAQFGLAKALGPHDATRARALAIAARDTYRAAEADNSAELAEVQAWLARRF